MSEQKIVTTYSQDSHGIAQKKDISEVSPEKKLKRRVANAIYLAPDDLVQKFARMLKIQF